MDERKERAAGTKVEASQQRLIFEPVITAFNQSQTQRARYSRNFVMDRETKERENEAIRPFIKVENTNTRERAGAEAA